MAHPFLYPLLQSDTLATEQIPGALEMRSHWCTHRGEPGRWVPGAYVGADYSNGNGSPGLVPGVCPGPLLCICVCGLHRQVSHM